MCMIAGEQQIMTAALSVSRPSAAAVPLAVSIWSAPESKVGRAIVAPAFRLPCIKSRKTAVALPLGATIDDNITGHEGEELRPRLGCEDRLSPSARVLCRPAAVTLLAITSPRWPKRSRCPRSAGRNGLLILIDSAGAEIG